MNRAREKSEWLAAYRARTEALERVRAHELVAMTQERAREIMASLVAVETPWRQEKDWSGLVEQQAIFHRGRKR